jgi:aspartyl-tRNA(Asn)/glutamyl-tRNA(Gln) amidotransferase subunit B
VVEEAVKQAAAGNPKAVDDYMKGKETAAKYLVGQVMRITKGKANPAVAVDLVKKELDALQKG